MMKDRHGHGHRPIRRLSVIVIVTVTVNDVNEAADDSTQDPPEAPIASLRRTQYPSPDLHGGDLHASDDPDDDGDADLVWSLTGTDARRLQSSTSGRRHRCSPSRKSPDYEKPAATNNLYRVTVHRVRRRQAHGHPAHDRHRNRRARGRRGNPVVGAAQGCDRADRVPGGLRRRREGYHLAVVLTDCHRGLTNATFAANAIDGATSATYTASGSR